ncbi:flagellar hook-associated protein FlgL [Halalkalibacillus sediminis]|uniref:Flagellar hook-associated protein FlgL n=1 Tax=Halalkalibacillus sediminis TaxID=2018042 RepID=A0A2I0QUK9_9BACI|nr:flagellar hook-associated protein FlgL [Halalkalibacillus sediminis]PKR77984.1 flagellar hook-associated protein FlgL [Halalkalibacillus sediminis]
MRVTQGMLNNNMLRNVSQSYNQMDKYMDQLSTGKKINRPSDDPVVAMRGVSHRESLAKVEQFERNISEVNSWMDNSDATMNEAGNALHKVRELVIQASNDTYEESQRENISKEVSQLRDHLKELANTKVNNKYIFNGSNTTEPRFNEDGTLNVPNPGDAPNNQPVNIEVSEGVRLQANVNPNEVFSQDMFDDLDDLVAKLEDENATPKELDSFISDMDQHSQNLVNERADLGARMNRVEMVEDRLGQQNVSVSKLMSDNEDADIEEVIMNLKMQESVHRASLGAGARIMQPSLLDFLR